MSFNLRNESFGYDNNEDNHVVMNRKFAKTCVEKKRRDRINRCLDELKDLMSQSEDKAKYQKMEKAEILEMAVGYMRNMKQSNINQQQSPVDTTTNYNHAYKQCLTDFHTQLQTIPGIHDEYKSQIMNKMSLKYTEMTQGSTKSLKQPQSKKIK